ncbi:hypothetical protein D9758_014600 [Tetrapyrgos nigripes]|uniref:Uncharacterized protein n=1 Tax=Tetrapyrgos nigripes TaxID=182062 RepID=A0A8H5BYR7_9AGAR|nr:hypothetical protein D9758_014600 [Tetrapyrgos nigripes]
MPLFSFSRTNSRRGMEPLRQKLRKATGEVDRPKQTTPPVILLAKNKAGTLDIKEKYGYVSKDAMQHP